MSAVEAGAAPSGRGRALHPGHGPAWGDTDCADGATASPEGREETHVFLQYHIFNSYNMCSYLFSECIYIYIRILVVHVYI